MQLYFSRVCNIVAVTKEKEWLKVNKTWVYMLIPSFDGQKSDTNVSTKNNDNDGEDNNDEIPVYDYAYIKTNDGLKVFNSYQLVTGVSEDDKPVFEEKPLYKATKVGMMKFYSQIETDCLLQR